MSHVQTNAIKLVKAYACSANLHYFITLGVHAISIITSSKVFMAIRLLYINPFFPSLLTQYLPTKT